MRCHPLLFPSLLPLLLLLANAGALASGSIQGLSPDALNESLSIDVFSTNNLWEEKDDDVARRLRLPIQTRTSYESGYGYEPLGSSRVLGAEVFSISLQGRGGKPCRISILFANKGDILHYATPEERKGLLEQSSRAGTSGTTYSPQLIEKYRSAIRKDAFMISAKLTKLLGAGGPVRNFKTSWMSEEGTRWNWNGTSFFLFAPRNEYLTLRVEPSSIANDLESERKAFAAAKNSIASRVVHRPNGDTIIEDIPMIDQGSKGYCVPATLERLLRYYNIDADMNMLAMGGRTGVGGGTSFDTIFPIINELVRNAGGTLKQQQFTGKISDIKLAIDDGKPVIWGLYSSDEFNDILEERNARRLELSNWNQWRTDLLKTRETAHSLPRKSAHCCMITGYNESTHELAISDSWGPEFKERWVTEEEAVAVNQGETATIGW